MEPPLTPTTRAKSRLQWIWPLAIASLILFASSRSTVAAPSITNFDKLVHFLAFGLLATLMCRLGHGWRSAGWSLLIASAFGGSDEWHQSFVPGRFSDVFDWVADTLGAGVAVGLYAGWPWYRNLLERPLWSHPRKSET
jgi:VanZ family protein